MRLSTPILTVACLCLCVCVLVCVGAPQVRSTATTPHRNITTPVVLIHGISASNASLSHVKTLLQSYGAHVLNLNIGDGPHDSNFMQMFDQSDFACFSVRLDPNLRNGFHLIGMSQGGLVARGMLQRCPDIKVHSFISWVSPQAGQFGVPTFTTDCRDLLHLPLLCDVLNNIVDTFTYDESVQKLLSFLQYWKDPYKMSVYREKSLFLGEINNARPHPLSQQYKDRILSLKHFMLVHSTVDVILVPKETSAWGFYAPGSITKIIPLKESPIYQEDWLGLRALDESGRLSLMNTTCIHQDYDTECFDKYFMEGVFPLLAD